ncbi:hypothetical protein PG994_007001 [Apiospora phragmitis]|uniref:Apple domain-containing protein n=1 Tax=Apiospora phragmitis TaxID=2905665 RepID=A0ABR1UZI7_9PEZI
MIPEPRTVEESTNVHEEPRSHLATTEEFSSTPGLQTVSGPQVVAAPPHLQESIPSELEALSADHNKMMLTAIGSAGSTFAPPQPSAGMIPWDREAEQKMTVKHGVGDKGKARERRRWIWGLGIIVLLALVTALGLGLGLSMRSKRLGGSSGGSDRPSAASNGTSSAPTASTATAPSPSASDPAPSCPDANNTVYTTPADEDGSGSTQYRRICGVSYDGNDIQPEKAETMGRCLALCSGQQGSCAGVVWYDAGPQGTDLNWCWLKRSMEKAVLSYRDSAQTAIRL